MSAILAGCAVPSSTPTNNLVAKDVLFVVLGKMSLYDQSHTGEINLRNHHFVAEIMPKAERKILSGSLTNATDPSQVIAFAAEGTAHLAHGARVSDPEELHRIHPDGKYVFSYRTQSGRMQAQTLSLAKRAEIDSMPAPQTVAVTQNDASVVGSWIDPDSDLTLSWTTMPGNGKSSSSELEDLIFVLAFDCHGNNIAHSGRPYQGGPYLNYTDTSYTIQADAIEPGLRYTFIVEQATADVDTYQGVPGIATYATLTFVQQHTIGENEIDRCPAAP